MKRYLLIGLVCGALALVGGAALASPSIELSASVAAAQATPAPTAQPNAPNPRSNRSPRQGDQQRSARGKGQRLALMLGRATADVTGMEPKEVLAEVQGGKSLAQIAQEHGKTADDILAKLRELGQQRLDQALDKARELIDEPGLRGDRTPQPSPTAEPST